MSDTQTGTPTKSYAVTGITGPEPTTIISFPLKVTPKGLKTFTIDLDELELEATGTKSKNGQVVNFMTFKIPTK